MPSEKNTTEPKPKAKQVTIKEFLGMCSINTLNQFVILKRYANSDETKTPKQWNDELKKDKGLVFKFVQ